MESTEIDIFNCIPGGLFTFVLKDEEPYIDVIMWNKIMVEITGYSVEEINVKKLTNIFTNKEEGVKSIKSSIEEIYRGNDKKEMVHKVITKDGVRKIISINLSVINYENKKYTAIALVKDITIEKEKEMELKEIYERYKKILENSTDAILIYGDLKLIYVNQKALNMLEIDKAEDIIGQPVLKIIHPDYHELVRARIKESHEKEGGVQLIEEKFVTSKGKVIDVEIQMTYIPYKGTKCNVAFIRNITKRKGMQNKLEKSEKYFKKLFNNVNDSIFLNKIDENGMPSVFIDANDVACDKLGYTREELRAMTAFQVSSILKKERVLYLVDQLTKKGNVTSEGIVETKSGLTIPVEMNSIFLMLDNEKHILSIARDISERKKNEKALRIKAQEYRQLVEALPYGVYIQNKKEMLFSNKVGLEYLGISSLDEVKGKVFAEVLKPHPSYEEQHRKNLQNFIDKGYTDLSEEKLIRIKDNKVLDLETIVTKYPYGLCDDTSLVVTRDISDRKKAEALERDMDEKTKLLEQVSNYEKLRTEFFANISHELRTPVNVIFSTLQLISYNIGGQKNHDNNINPYKKYVDIMKQNCFRLVRLINNLIDVTKIDSGYFKVNLINGNIISIVEDITQSVAEYISNKGISLIFDTEVEEKIMACDPDKIERIILNLISNAVKFTPAGGSLFVNIKDKGNKIVISVKDTGTGIPKSKQKLIFERFVQVDKSLTRKNEGSGIGLSLVKSLVEMHKGTITVQSELNKGSEFFIELPVYTIKDSKNNKSSNDYLIQDNVEKINIEFSDIYF